LLGHEKESGSELPRSNSMSPMSPPWKEMGTLSGRCQCTAWPGVSCRRLKARGRRSTRKPFARQSPAGMRPCSS